MSAHQAPSEAVPLAADPTAAARAPDVEKGGCAAAEPPPADTTPNAEPRNLVVGPPYPAAVFALRLAVPQCFLAVWFVFLWLACYGTSPSEHTYAGETLTVEVGPACVMPPPPPVSPSRPRRSPSTARPLPGTPLTGRVREQPANDALVAACPANNAGPPGPLGPQVRTTSSTPYKLALAPEKAVDESFGAAPAKFHWNISAITRAATCKEAAAAGAHVAGVLDCAHGDVACSVHFFAGELFLTLSPAWMHAYSFGMLEADTSYMVITLVEGWDSCMSEAPLPGMHPLDSLVAHLFKEAGRPAGGYLAREAWPATHAAGHGVFATTSGGPTNTTHFTVFDLVSLRAILSTV